LEVEYLKNPLFDRKYPKDTKDGTSFSGLPFIEDYDLPPTHHAEDFRWSLSLQKALGNWIDLKLRCSSDHMRLLGWNGDYVDGEPFVKRSGDWLFLIRLEYHN
jgi:hypothetical protein